MQTTDTLQGTKVGSEQTTHYGLEGIVLHNSFDQVKGRTIRIDCRERTHIGGANGAGKTSTLALIPAFFGEEPERIVSRSSGRLSFVDYYLPNQQALIIFEYRRHSGLCCAVMFRHHSGKLCYRFVEGSAADTFFAPDTIELLKSGALNKEIFDKLRAKGLNVSSTLDTITDYRAILQNNPKLLRRQPTETRRLRRLAADFSLGGPDTHMSHIERLTHVVLNRSRLLSSFKTMICETQFENIHLNTRPKPIDEQGLVQDIKSLKAFDKEEASIRACLKREAERQSILASARVTSGNLSASAEEAREKHADLQSEAGRIHQAIEEMETEFSALDSTRTQAIEQKAHAKAVRKNDLDEIYNQRDEYEQQGAPDLAQEFENLPEYKRQLADAQEDLSRVTSQVSELQTEHDQAIERIEHKFQGEQEKRNVRIQDEKAAQVSATHTHEQELSALKSERVEQESQLKEARSFKRSQLSNQLARVETLRDNTGQTETESQQIKDSEEAVRQAEEDARKIEEDLGEEKAKCEQARQDRNTAQDAFEIAEQHLASLRADAEKLKKRLSPENGSWLSQLRREDPCWADGLAKVINPDLLERVDLQPRKVTAGPEHSELVMGWSLALEELPVPNFAASEDELQGRLRELDHRIDDAIKKVGDTEKSAKDRNSMYAKRQKAVERKETEKTLSQNILGRTRAHLSVARNEVDSAIKQRKQEHEKQARQLAEQIETFDSASQALIRDLADDFSRRTVERKAAWSEIKADLDARIDNARKLAAEAAKEHKARIQTMNEAYHQRLQEEGIDTAIVQKLRQRVNDIQQKVKRIEEGESLIRDYKDWTKKQWSRVKSLSEEIESLGREQSALESAQQEQRRIQREAIKTKVEHAKQLETRARQINEQIEQAENTLRQFNAMSETPAKNGFPGSLTTLIQDLQEDCSRLEKLRGEVIKAFSRAQAVLNSYTGTQIYQSWQNHLQYRRRTLSDPAMEYDDNFKLKLVEELRLLLDTDVPHLKSAVIEQFASHAGNLKDYFDSLDTMAREVKRVSNRLRQQINTDQQIDSISDIRVELQARIEDDESWRPLKSFVEQWGDWHALNPREIPSNQIIAAFQLVTDTLKSASVGQSIETMIDMKLIMKENDREVVIRNDNDFLNASSEGLTYLAIMAVFMGMTRYLCPDLTTRITWPVDEIGKLDPQNISRLASMLEHNNLTMISACPELNRPLRKFFETKVSIKDGRVHNFETTATAGNQGPLLSALVKRQPTTTEEGAPNVG